MTGLDYFVGKTVTHVDASAHDDFALVHFSDGTSWLVTATRWNCCGARLEHRISHEHHLPEWAKPKKEEQA